MSKLFLLDVVMLLFFLCLLCMRQRMAKLRVALLLSGETRSFDMLQDDIRRYVNCIESSNNAIVDVYLCLGTECNFDIRVPNVRGIRYDKENIKKDTDYTYQMYRWNLCYNSVPKRRRYDWFIRSRPDMKLIRYDIDFKLLDKTKLHVRYRLSKNNKLNRDGCSWWTKSGECIESGVNVVDDQFFIVHSSIADKVFSINRGKEKVISRQTTENIKMQEDIFNEMLMSHGVDTENLLIKTKLIR